MFSFFKIGTPNNSKENIYTYAHILSSHTLNGTLDINAVKELYDFSTANSFTEQDFKEAQSEACFRVWAGMLRDGIITHDEEALFNKFLKMCTGLTETEKANWRKKLNDTQLSTFSKQDIKSTYKIFHDCINIIDSTTNIETALMRYSLALEKIKKLKSYTQLQLSIFDINRDKLIEMENHLIENKVEIINEIIDKAYTAQLAKVNNFRKQSTRTNSMSKFFSKITSVQGLPSASLDYCYVLMGDYDTPTPAESNSVPAIVPKADVEEIPLNHYFPPAPKTDNTDAFLNIPNNIIRLLWFSDGNLKNYTPAPRNKSNHGIITVSFYGPEEPSAISVRCPIGLPQSPEPQIGYFPTYKGLEPEARACYLNWLQDVTQPIDIGYVFIFYYGLERHLFSCGPTSEEAFEMIELLRKHHSHSSFQSYSHKALIGASIKMRRKDLLERVIADNPEYLDDFTIECYSILGIPLDAEALISMASMVGFTNRRYINQQRELFVKCLNERLLDSYQTAGFVISPKYFEGAKKRKQRISANISLEDLAEIEIYDIIRNLKFQQDVSSLLSETHERVKVILRESRKKKK